VNLTGALFAGGVYLLALLAAVLARPAGRPSVAVVVLTSSLGFLLLIQLLEARPAPSPGRRRGRQGDR
jgi:hypothetical protein